MDIFVAKVPSPLGWLRLEAEGDALVWVIFDADLGKIWNHK